MTESEQKPRRIPLRQTATWKRAHGEFAKAGREYYYRMALLGGKQMGTIACAQPSYVTGPELEMFAKDYADAWLAYELSGEAVANLKDQYGGGYRNPWVDENDEIVPDPAGQ